MALTPGLDSLIAEEMAEAERCNASPDGKHHPDPSTVHVTYDGSAYVDVNCKHCGRSGCLAAIGDEWEAEIDW